MRDQAIRVLFLGIVGVNLILPPSVHAQSATAAPGTDQPKKVLVELYTSQGCNSCPPASDLLAKLKSLGYGPDQVIPINFHVDYFNTPWEDPYSDPSFSDREQSYNQVMKRTDLYFTPLMMVDGRYPLLGSNRQLAETSIRQARQEPAKVALDLSLEGDGLRKTLAVKLMTRAPELAGRDLLIGVALTQDRTTTRVASGENAGKTIIETDVVRRLDHKFTRLDRAVASNLIFPVAIPSGGDPAHFRVTVFAQDRGNGKVYQADAIPWNSTTPPSKP